MHLLEPWRARAAGALPAAAGRRPGPLLFAMTEPGGAGSDPVLLQTTARPTALADQRPQVADHRRRGRGLRDHHGPLEGGPMAARHDVPAECPTRRSGSSAARHDGRQPDRRPLGGRLQRPAPAGRRRAGRGRPGLPLRPGAPGPGAAHPLHALAGRGPPRARRRRRLRPHAPRLRQAAGRARGRRLHAGRQPDGHAPARLSIWHCAWVLDQGERAPNESRWPRSCARRRWAASSTARADAGRPGITARPWSSASSGTCGPSASTTAPPRCTAGRSARASSRARCS